MGVLDSVRGLFARPRALVAADAPSVVVAPTKTEGIPGGGNYAGRLLYENNALLRDRQAYGRAGTYDVGAWQDLALTNPYVTAGLDFILSPVRDARIDVQEVPVESLGNGLTADQAKQHATFLRWALTDSFRLSTHVVAAARGFLPSGFALFEPRAALMPCPVLARPAFGLAAIEQRLPNSLSPNAWREDNEGRLIGINQLGPKGGNAQFASPTIESSRALLYSWKRVGNNWAGESQLRSAWYIAGKVMPMLLKSAGVTVQREGAGLPVAFQKDDTAELTPSQRDEMVTVLSNLSAHEAASVVMPPGWDVKWIFSPGADKTFIIDMWKQLGLVVLQQLSAQQIALGTDNTGSRSVGEVHDARAMAFVRNVLGFVESVLNGDSGEAHTGLARRLIEWNFGPQPAYPRVVLTAKRPELSPKELGESVAAAKAAGVFTPTLGDENAFRSAAGLPPISEEEREAAKPATVAPMPIAPKNEGGDGDALKGPLQASAPRATWAPWRPLRASEQRVDWAGIDRYFTEQRETFEKRVRPVVVGMLAKAGPLIVSAMADGEVSPEEIANIPLDASRLSKVVAEYLAQVRNEGGASARRELGTGVLRAEEGAEEEEEEDEQLVVDEATRVIDAEHNRVVRRIVNRTRGELEREGIDALRTGANAADVLDRAVTRQLDSGAFRTDAGSITTKAFNVGRDEAARILGGVAEVEYSAILDSATCDACRSMDGATAEFNSAEHDRMLPPNRDCAGGDNCRCLLVLIPERGGE